MAAAPPVELVDVAVVGAGPGGLAAAVALRTANPHLSVKVYERARALAPGGFVIALLPNAMKAVRAMDEALWQALRGLQWPVANGASVQCAKDGTVQQRLAEDHWQQFYGRHGGALSPLAWYDLQQFWASWLPAADIVLGRALRGYEEEEDAVRLSFEGGQEVRARILVGADGNLSAVRRQLLGGADGGLCFSGMAFWRAMGEQPEGWDAEPGRKIWSDARAGATVVAHTFPDGRLAWLAAARWPPERLAELAPRRYIDGASTAADGEARLARCLEVLGGGWAEEAMRVLTTTSAPSAVAEHPLYYREPESCQVWGAGRVTLLGDAAHLSPPTMGQGTSQATEDALELARAVGAQGPTPEALRAYEAVRQPQAGEVQATAVRLLKEMLSGSGGGGGDFGRRERETSATFFGREWAPLPRAPGPRLVQRPGWRPRAPDKVARSGSAAAAPVPAAARTGGGGGGGQARGPAGSAAVRVL